MGKRSDYQKRKHDQYFTPIEAVKPLIPHLPHGTFFYDEPCAGAGRLVSHITDLTDGKGVCLATLDIDPQFDGITKGDALTDDYIPSDTTNLIITNPPWTRQLLHPMIEKFSSYKPTWLLFDADWMHTKQSAPFMVNCRKIVSVGRVKWIENSKQTGKDNCAWYLFEPGYDEKTEFVGR